MQELALSRPTLLLARSAPAWAAQHPATAAAIRMPKPAFKSVFHAESRPQADRRRPIRTATSA